MKGLFVALVILLPSILSAAPLKVAMDAVFSPYCYIDENGKPAGFYYEIINKMFEVNKVEYELNAYPWARIVALTDENSLDVSIPWRTKAERFEKYNMIGPFTSIGSSYYFFRKKGTNHTWNEMNDIKGKRVGVVRGFAYPADFEKMEGVLKEEANDTETLVKMLAAGRVDFVLSDEIVIIAEMKKQKLMNLIERTGKPIETIDRYIVVPKQKPELAAKITEMFKKFSKSAEYKKIVKKYVK